MGLNLSENARPIDFGKIEFLSGAREHLLRMSDELMDSAEAADAHFKQKLEQLNSFWKNEIAQKGPRFRGGHCTAATAERICCPLGR